MPPQQRMALIQEDCSDVMGPDAKGVSSDSNTGKLGDVQTQPAPYAMAIKFTELEDDVT